MLEGIRGLILFKEAELRKSLAESLASANSFIYPYKKTGDLLTAISKDHPHYIVLDDKSATEQGGWVLEKIREHKTHGPVPVVVLSESLALTSKRFLIEKGADRILKYKTDPDNLALEVFALLRRSHSYSKAKEALQFGDISLNPEHHQARVSGKVIKFTRIEFKVFQELLSKRGEVVSREKLSQSFLSLRNSSDRTLDVHINALRKKLGSKGHNLTTIRGRGYMFRA